MGECADCGAQARDEFPDRRRLLDEALEPPPRYRRGAHGPAAPSRRRAVIVKFDAGVGPFVFVRLVADGEIEAPKPKLDRMREQFAQMQRAWAVMRHRGVVLVARQYVVIAIAEQDGEIRRRPGVADFDAADVEAMADFRI